jgi:hypothetical protein
MNAHKTLTQDTYKVADDKDKWKKLISIIPSPHFYLNGEGSSAMNQRYTLKRETKLTLSTIHKAFNSLSRGRQKFIIEEIDKNKVVSDLKDNAYEDTVLIFCINKPTKSSLYDSRKIEDHWVCAVGKNSKNLFVQCSYVIHDVDKYRIKKVPKSDRYYNESIGLRSLKVQNISKLAYKISLKK